MAHKINIKWGKRCNIANMFPTIGTLEEMHRSLVIRGILVEKIDAKDMSTHGITQNPLGKWETAKPERDSEITLEDEDVLLFASFINDLSSRRQVPMAFADVFTDVVNIAKEITPAEEEGGE